MIQEGPTEGALVDITSEQPPRDLDPLVGLPQSAWHHIHFLVRDAGGGLTIHTNNARVRVKRSWTQIQVCVVQLSFSCVEHNGEGFNTFLLHQSWWWGSHNVPKDLDLTVKVCQIARLHPSLCLAGKLC